jgi:recombination associated protein RdgC
MFKVLSLFNFQTAAPMVHGLAEEHLQEHSFVPCGPTQASSIGWVPPRGDSFGALVESIDNQWILKLQIETKKVPSDVVERKLQERKAAIEEQTGRKPGKKESKELKEEIVLELLPSAFPTRSAVLVWIDVMAKTIAVGATGSKADLAITSLVRAMHQLVITPLTTLRSPSGCMAAWLVDGACDESFSIDRSLELKACDESKAKVKYDNHALDIKEIVGHIEGGKSVTKMAMTYSDSVSFVLTEDLVLQKIQILDIVFENSHGDAKDDAFDSDVAITTGTLRLAILHLVDALGGQTKPEEKS